MRATRVCRWHVRVGCVFEELCDEVGRAFESDGLTGRCLGCRHGRRVCETSRRTRVYSTRGDHVEGVLDLT